MDRYIHTFDQSISAGISIPKKQNSKFYFIPIAGIGFRQFLNLKNFQALEGHTFYEDIIVQDNSTGTAYLHGAATFKIKNILLGAAFTQFQGKDYYGLSLGYQSKDLKLISNWMVGRVSFQEISLSYTIDY